MEIKKDEVGEKYYEALKKMIEIRKDRRKIYGDTFLEDSKDFLLMQIENKIKRIRLHITNQTEINDTEKAEDNSLDIANYALFLACILNRK